MPACTGSGDATRLCLFAPTRAIREGSGRGHDHLKSDQRRTTTPTNPFSRPSLELAAPQPSHPAGYHMRCLLSHQLMCFATPLCGIKIKLKKKVVSNTCTCTRYIGIYLSCCLPSQCPPGPGPVTRVGAELLRKPIPL